MNKNYLDLGKEIIREISTTWNNLGYLNVDLISEKAMESIGRDMYSNKEIFSDYLYYKYELEDYYTTNNLAFNCSWFAEWWSDERGESYQRHTFGDLASIVIDTLTNAENKWYYDEESDLYLPQGYIFSTEKGSVVLICNTNIIADFKYAQALN